MTGWKWDDRTKYPRAPRSFWREVLGRGNAYWRGVGDAESALMRIYRTGRSGHSDDERRQALRDVVGSAFYDIYGRWPLGWRIDDALDVLWSYAPRTKKTEPEIGTWDMCGEWARECSDLDCGGCSCFLRAPCSHCMEHPCTKRAGHEDGACYHESLDAPDVRCACCGALPNQPHFVACVTQLPDEFVIDDDNPGVMRPATADDYDLPDHIPGLLRELAAQPRRYRDAGGTPAGFAMWIERLLEDPHDDDFLADLAEIARGLRKIPVPVDGKP